MARPRKSSATLTLHGGYRADRHGEPEPASVGELIKPSDLDDAAEWFWDQHLEQFIANGAGGGDLGTIIECCLSYSRMKTIEAMWKKDPENYKKLCMIGMTVKVWITLASKLGLSPAERAKLRVAPKKERDDFEDFLNKKA